MEMSPAESASSPQSSQPSRRQFLAGPLDWPTFRFVLREGGVGAVGVWVALHHRLRLRKAAWVSLPNAELQQMGVSRGQKLRAIAFLQAEGLIRIEGHGKGRTARYALTTRTRVEAAAE
jgi:hypothetical protein